MPDRREFLAASALVAAGLVGGLRRAEGKTTTPWKPYRDAIAIDGEGGFNLFVIDDNDPEVATDLAAARACGLSGVFFSVAPNGRFWMDDAAFTRVKDFCVKSKAKIGAHADTFLLVETADDLKRAHH